jgi:hypothetical protein
MQFGFRNKVSQEMEFDFLVTNELVNVNCAGSWQSCRALNFLSPIVDAGEEKKSGADLPEKVVVSADIPDSTVPAGFYLIVRWRREPAVNAAALAIDDLAVTFESPSSFVIIVR